MADNILRFDMVGRDRLSDKFDGVADKGEGLGRRLGRVGKTIGLALGGVAVAGIGAVGAALFEGGKAAARYEVLAKKSAAVIKSTGNLANISVKGIQNLAGSLESLSGVDEELIINSQNVLATFTNIRNVGKQKIFDQATKSALDMSVALGSDLQGATIQIGKALNDPIKGVTALSKVGVTFTQQQRDQIKALVDSGKTMDAQKLILAELNKEFGGAAKAAGDSFTGQVERAKDAVGDLSRDIGAKALPVLGKLADWVAEKGVPKLREFSEWLSVKGVPLVKDGAERVRAVLGGIGDRLDLGDVGRRLADKARMWASGIVSGLQKGIETGDWSQLGTALGDALNDAVMGVGNLAIDIGGMLKDWAAGVKWVKLGEDIGKQALPFVVGFLAGFLDPVAIWDSVKEDPGTWAWGIVSATGIGKVAGPLGKILAKIPILRAFVPLLKSIEKLTSPLTKTFDKVFGFLKESFLKGFRKFIPEGAASEPIRRFFDGIGARILYLGEDIKGWVEKVVGFIPEKFGQLTGLVGSKLAKWAGDVLSSLGRGLLDATKKVTGPVRRVVGRMLSAIGDFFGKARSKGADFIGRVAGGIRSRVGRAVGAVRDGMGRAVKAVGDAAGRVRTKAWSFVNNLRDVLRRGVSRFGALLLGAGGDLIEGLAEGWDDAKWRIEQKVKRLADWVRNTLRSMWEFGSPSKMTRRFGRWLGEGAALGIGDRTRMVGRAAEKMAAAARPDMSVGVDLGPTSTPAAPARLGALRADSPGVGALTGMRASAGGGDIHVHIPRGAIISSPQAAEDLIVRGLRSAQSAGRLRARVV